MNEGTLTTENKRMAVVVINVRNKREAQPCEQGGGGNLREGAGRAVMKGEVLPAQCRAGEPVEEALICNLLMRDRICGWSRV